MIIGRSGRQRYKGRLREAKWHLMLHTVRPLIFSKLFQSFENSRATSLHFIKDWEQVVWFHALPASGRAVASSRNLASSCLQQTKANDFSIHIPNSVVSLNNLIRYPRISLKPNPKLSFFATRRRQMMETKWGRAIKTIDLGFDYVGASRRQCETGGGQTFRLFQKRGILSLEDIWKTIAYFSLLYVTEPLPGYY